MIQLNAPQLSNILPPSYGNSLHLVGKKSPAVGPDDFTYYRLLIKKINGDYLGDFTIEKNKIEINEQSAFDTIILVPNNILSTLLEIGSFYKVQLAYEKTINNNDSSSTITGYYSNVGTMKYTGEPQLEITHPSSSYQFVCKYKNADISEKLVSISAKIYTESDLLFNIPEQYHNNSADENKNINNQLYLTAQETIILPYAVNIDTEYFVDFYFKTINGFELTETVTVPKISSTSPITNIDFTIFPNENIGGTILQITNCEQVDSNTFAYGSYRLWKKHKNQNYWGLLATWDFPNTQAIITKTYSDYLFTQNEPYQYMLQKMDEQGIILESSVLPQVFNEGKNPPAWEPAYVAIDFEDLFLYDGERQLKIKFDPKVSSIKQNYQETKFESLGDQFPHFSRGGKLNYMEFSLSGLISYHMDDMRTFLTSREIYELNLNDELNNNTQLSVNNIYAERLFKIKVLDWLNNGQPKLLRSSTEGNYIVYLMNASLSPNDTLGRMIHSFSCTAYELDRISAETLDKYDLLQLQELEQSNLIDKSQPLIVKIQNNLNIEVADLTIINNPFQYDQINIVPIDFTNYLEGKTRELNNLTKLSVPLAYNTNLTSVGGPLTSLPDHAFDNCSNLTTVNFPNLTVIVPYAFNNCVHLNTINYFPNVTIISAYAFYNCYNLNFPVNYFDKIQQVHAYGLARLCISNSSTIKTFNLPNAKILASYACANNDYATAFSAPMVSSVAGRAFASFGFSLTNSQHAAILLANAWSFSGNCFFSANLDTLVFVKPDDDLDQIYEDSWQLKSTVISKIQSAGLTGSALTLYVPQDYVNAYKNSALPWGTNVVAIEGNQTTLIEKGLVLPDAFNQE